MIISDELVDAYAGPYKTGELTPINESLEKAAIAEIFGYLSRLRPSGSWTNSTNTPMLVQKLIAMYYVGRCYQESYAQDVGVSDYGSQLIKDMYALLKKIMSGDVIIIDQPEVLLAVPSLSFEFPDTPKFTMGDRF